MPDVCNSIKMSLEIADRVVQNALITIQTQWNQRIRSLNIKNIWEINYYDHIKLAT